jgi:hypothetical protein
VPSANVVALSRVMAEGGVLQCDFVWAVALQRVGRLSAKWIMPPNWPSVRRPIRRQNLVSQEVQSPATAQDFCEF